MNTVIQGLWIGKELTALERLSIRSFLANGHEYHLYTYGDVSGAPRGTLLRDARAIFPRESVFRYRDQDSVAGFANSFRYKLLAERGGWWADTDVVCLRPFDFPEAVVIATEPTRVGSVVCNAVLKAPAGHPMMRWSQTVCSRKDPRKLHWGETGSELLTEAVRRFRAQRYIRKSRVFCPVGYQRWQELIRSPTDWDFTAETHAVHCWNEMWRRAGQDKSGAYSPGCLYEMLKRWYPEPVACVRETGTSRR